MDLSAKRVTVMGLGRFGGGLGAVRFLVRQGADVLVTDQQSAEQLKPALEQLAGLPIQYRLGEHNVSDFTTADLVVANPAVPPNNRFLRAAEAANIPITTEVRLLIERLPNRQRTIGVTGTSGKSTTASMIAHLLHKTAGACPLLRAGVWLGGNIGGSLLDQLDQITPDDWIVLELSSFMLHYLRDGGHFRGWSPHIAVITNIAPNHLDWHGSYESYIADKRVILEYQSADDSAILGPGVEDWSAPGHIARPTPHQWSLLTPGKHNCLNADHALAACRQVDANIEADPTCHNFAGLAHRLQFVTERAGVRCYNDSKSTTPQAAMLAIESFPSGGVHIILGGYDKGSDLTQLARFAAACCAAIYTIGVTGPRISEAASAAGRSCPVHDCRDLDTAVARALASAQPGQVLLLSPGCASWDQFTDFEQRGQRFVQLVTNAAP
ncbi:MAG: UDP-N-acetylmuramoyl-L-alanine--D-glutamate ligase [Phycisphaeraceae bacterium]|nr:UDP-N-acetylmuramoyl-L-alanine--D-glutamate ligase [Phycisphaeraceae bacterium]